MRYLADGGEAQKTATPTVTGIPTATVSPTIRLTVKPTGKTATTSGYVYRGKTTVVADKTGKMVDLALFIIIVLIILAVASFIKVYGKQRINAQPVGPKETPDDKLHPVKTDDGKGA